jgi:hypothetical protein
LKRAGPLAYPNHVVLICLGNSFAGRDAFDFIAADNIVKNGITEDPVASVVTHDPEKWPERYLANSELIDATNPNLTTFFARGGKIIVVHSPGDYCVSYERAGQYFRSVEARMGKETTAKSFRYFVAPILADATAPRPFGSKFGPRQPALGWSAVPARSSDIPSPRVEGAGPAGRRPTSDVLGRRQQAYPGATQPA